SVQPVRVSTGTSASKGVFKVVAWLMQSFMVSIQNPAPPHSKRPGSSTSLRQATSIEQFAQSGTRACARDAPLTATVAIADRDGIVGQGLAVDGDAEWRSSFILSAITPADGSLFVVRNAVVPLQVAIDRLGTLRHPVALYEWENGRLDGRDPRMEFQDRP